MMRDFIRHLGIAFLIVLAIAAIMGVSVLLAVTLASDDLWQVCIAGFIALTLLLAGFLTLMERIYR